MNPQAITATAGANARWLHHGLLVVLPVVLLIALSHCPTALAQPQQNPLSGFFPYGVYIGYALSPMMGREAGDRDLEAQCRFVVEDLRVHNMNCVWANNNSMQTGLRAWLAAARGSDVRVIHQSGGGPDALGSQSGPEGVEWVETTAIPFFEQHAADYRDEPALLAYSLTEEVPPDRLPGIERMTRWLEQWDPKHPGIVLYNSTTTGALAAREVRPAVMVRDLYPFFDGWSSAASLTYYLHNLDVLARATRQAGIPLWVMGQSSAIDYRASADEPWKPIWRQPTEAELRFQLWGAVYSGATGFFWFVYHSQEPETGERILGLAQPKAEESDMMRQVSALGADLEPLMATILDWRLAPPEHESVYFAYSRDLLGRTFESSDGALRYVLVLNTDLEQAQPHQQALLHHKADCAVYDLRTLEEVGPAGAEAAPIPPGGAAVFLVGSREDFAEYKARFRAEATDESPIEGGE